MRTNIQIYVQVSWRTAFLACGSFTAYPQTGTIIHAGRNLNLQLLVLLVPLGIPLRALLEFPVEGSLQVGTGLVRQAEHDEEHVGKLLAQVLG